MILRLASIALILLMTGTAARSAAPLTVAAPEERPVRPLRGLIYSADEIREVRRIAREDPRLGKLAEEIFKAAGPWLAMTEAEIDALVPPADATFAYGFAGDPRTDESWPWYGRDGMCSLDRPGEVRSPSSGEVYGTAKPGEPYYDPGTGWVRPEDGKVFYFKGVWNSWVTREFDEAFDALALAYMLRGEERVARRALFILDRVATLRSLRPDDRGVADWPYAPPKGKGFLSHMGNNANRRMVESAIAFDLLAASAVCAEPSPGHPDLTLFENIRRNYFSFFEPEYIAQGESLQNHALIAYTNQIAQGLLFGDGALLESGIGATYGFLDNCINRDGEYYEVSGGYGQLGRSYGGLMVTLLDRYDRARYENAAAMPDPATYPYELKFGRDPRWWQTAVLSQYRLNVLGRDPLYGDAGPDRQIMAGRTAPKLLVNRASYLRLFHAQTDNPQWKEECRRLYWELPDSARDSFSLDSIGSLGFSQWTEPPRPEKTAAAASAKARPEPSILLPVKRTALLRAGAGKHERALFMRGGIGSSHGHDDQMALDLYGRGMMLTGEFGYNLAGTPDHRGIGTRGIAHMTAVVDEDLPASVLYKHAPTADIAGWGAEGPAQFIEMSNPAMWDRRSGVSEYRRLSWLVDVSREDFYFVDIFRITGGRTHDYAWNAPYLEPVPEDFGFAIGPVVPKAIEGVWTLASLGGKHRDAPWNERGRSWGERLLGNSGRIRNVKIPGEEKLMADRNWNPAPGNGYGFIYDVKAAETREDWWATWRLHDGKSVMKFTMLNPDGQTVATGLSPSLKLSHPHAVVVARRSGEKPLRSRFVSVTQVGDEGRMPVAECRLLPVETDGDAMGAIAVSIKLADGREDLIIATTDPAHEVKVADVTLKGERAFVRRAADGAVTEAMLSAGSRLAVGDLTLELPAAAWEATVTNVEAGYGANSIEVDRAWTTDDERSAERLVGQPAFFHPDAATSPTAAYNEYFRIEKIERSEGGSAVLRFDDQQIVSSRIEVKSVREDGTVEARWPNELASFGDMRQFDGHLAVVAGDPARRTLVIGYETKTKLRVADPKMLRAGDRLEILAVKPGDRMVIPSSAWAMKSRDGKWTVKANGEARTNETGGDAGSFN